MEGRRSSSRPIEVRSSSREAPSDGSSSGGFSRAATFSNRCILRRIQQCSNLQQSVLPNSHSRRNKPSFISLQVSTFLASIGELGFHSRLSTRNLLRFRASVLTIVFSFTEVRVFKNRDRVVNCFFLYLICYLSCDIEEPLYILAMVESSEHISNKTGNSDMIERETPQLLAVLKEMRDGLDKVTSKIQILTAKVKDNLFPTAEGLSYLEAKQLLLLNYCQSLVYYLLCKAKGFSIERHPVVLSLVETRLFLEKIRPIEKKLQYQTDKLMRVSEKSTDSVGVNATVEDPSKNEDDLLKYRPNPDMLISKMESVPEDEADTGLYRPPKFAPTTMEEDKMSKQERNAARKEKQTLRQASQSSYVRELMHDIEGKPEEVREEIGVESRELTNYRAKMEDRARREEDLFTRAPLTRMERTKMKHMKRSTNGLLGLTDSFYDEIKSLPLEEEEKKSSDNQPAVFGTEKTMKKQKRRH